MIILVASFSFVDVEQVQTEPRSEHFSLIAWLLVTIQAGLIIALVVLPGPSGSVSSGWRSVGLGFEIVGLVVVLVGAAQLGASLNFLPTPNRGGSLRTNGLYRFVRHPIYFGVMLFAFGSAMRAPTVERIAVVIGLDILLQFKAAWEEQRLIEKYPAYADYAKTNSSILPMRWPKKRH